MTTTTMCPFVDIYLFVGGGGTFSGIFFESSHQVCLIELLLYDNSSATRIKYIVHNVQDYRFSVVFFYNIAVLPVYVRLAFY